RVPGVDESGGDRHEGIEVSVPTGEPEKYAHRSKCARCCRCHYFPEVVATTTGGDRIPGGDMRSPADLPWLPIALSFARASFPQHCCVESFRLGRHRPLCGS